VATMAKMTGERRHRRFERWLSRQIDGRLSGGAEHLLESHLEGCAGCRRRREFLLEVRAEMAAADAIVARPGFADRVMAALGRDVLSPWLDVLPLLRGLAGAGFAICLVSLGLLWMRSSSAPAAPDLPMGRLDPITRELFRTGSVPREFLLSPRLLVAEPAEGR
jgi:anti-sigma factor RsiW